MQVHPFDPYATQENPVGGGVALSATQKGAGRIRRKMAFSAEEMRHHFAIETLGKPGPFAHSPIYLLAFAADGFFASMIRAVRSLPWTGWAGAYPNPKIPSA